MMTTTLQNDDNDDDEPRNDEDKKDKEIVNLRDDETTRKSRRKRKRKRKKKKDSDGEEHDDVVVPNNNNNDQSSSKEEEVERTVFVEGIPYDAQKEDVCNFFEEHDLKIVDCRLPVWQDTGRLRGYGHVVLESVQERDQALQLSGRHYLYNRYLTIQPAKPPKTAAPMKSTTSSSSAQEPTNTIILKNLSYQATESDIQAVMEPYGAIAQGGIRVVRHNASRQSRGFAYIEFVDVSSAQKVIESNNVVILGRPCWVDYDHGAIAKSFRTSTGRLWQKQYGTKRHKT